MLYIVLACVGICLIALIVIDIIDLNRFTVTQFAFADSKVTSDICFVVLGDLHNKTYGKDNCKLIAAIEEIAPDAVLCVGDIMTAAPGADFTPALHLMEALGRQYPVYYGIGNHEYRAGLYLNTYGDMYEKYFTGLQQAGIKVLRNEHIYLKDTNIDICGVEIAREYYKRFTTYPMKEDYLTSIIGEPNESAYQILLAHNPEYCPEYADWGADLTLSGHIHGGLIRLPILGGAASPAVKFFPKYSDGLYEVKGKRALVSCGLGTHTLPLRIWNPGEIVVVRLSPQSESKS